MDVLTRVPGAATSVLAFFALFGSLRAQVAGGYRMPPQPVVQALEQPAAPLGTASPGGRWVLVQHRRARPSITEFTRPIQHLDRFAVDVRTNSRWYPTLRPVEHFVLVDAQSGDTAKLDIPAGDFGRAVWSADGSRFAFTRLAEDHTELWVVDAAEQNARQIAGVRLNAARVSGTFGEYLPCSWMSDSRRMICLVLLQDRGAPPTEPEVVGPMVRETGPRADDRGTSPTRDDERRSGSHDAALFDYYMTAQPTVIDVVTQHKRTIAAPGVYDRFEPSPDGRHILSIRLVRPYPSPVDDIRSPRIVEILDARGHIERTIVPRQLEVSDRLTQGRVTRGPREFFWRPDAPAALVYYEALDGGDPGREVPHRDRLLLLPTPTDTPPRELFRSEFRMGAYPVRVIWGEDGLLLVEEYDYETHLRRTWKLQVGDSSASPELLFHFNRQDADAHPGQIVTVVASAAGGNWIDEALSHDTRLLQHGDWIYLRGADTGPSGSRSYLDRYNLKTGDRERLFESDPLAHEEVVSVLDRGARRLLIRTESPSVPSNLEILDRVDGTRLRLTNAVDQAPEVTQARHERVEYVRADGVRLSGELFLPQGYRAGERVPTVIWAYPMRYADVETAEQRRRSPNRFLGRRFTLSPLPLVTQGYAVFEARMPVIGDREANTTISRQLAANATAAVDKLVEIGVADRSRIGIAGHSYGGFMVGNLLAGTDLFAAGVAFAGLYDFTATPFGFNDEPRSFWEVPEVYDSVSPFRHADEIREPLLLVHGENDESSTGHKLQQSTRMFEAISGLGGTSRLVVLPHELHTPTARESLLHAHWEMLEWFDRHLNRTP